MAAITHVFTLARVAEMLGEDEDLLYEISIEMETEDGVIHVYGTDDDATTAFTDFGIRGIGRSLAEVFAEAARAMTAASVDLDAVGLHSSVEIVCAGADAEDMLYAWLNAVIYEMAMRRMVFGRFDVEIDDGTVRAIAWGETLLPERHQPSVEIKGATFTGLKVRKEGDEWVAECVVDV